MDIGRAMGGLAGLAQVPGDSSGWQGGTAQYTIPVTDLRPHVDGGPNSGRNTASNDDAMGTMRLSAGIVLVSAVLLAVMATTLFRSVNL